MNCRITNDYVRRGSTSLIVALLLLPLLSVACRRPESTEQFITIDKSIGGIYSFDLDLCDSLCTYDIWFYNRVEPALGGIGTQAAIPIAVKWQLIDSEEELSYTETVYHKQGGRRGGRELYRSSVIPAKSGRYSLELRPLEVPQGFNGIGVICKRKPLQ